MTAFTPFSPLKFHTKSQTQGTVPLPLGEVRWGFCVSLLPDCGGKRGVRSKEQEARRKKAFLCLINEDEILGYTKTHASSVAEVSNLVIDKKLSMLTLLDAIGLSLEYGQRESTALSTAVERRSFVGLRASLYPTGSIKILDRPCVLDRVDWLLRGIGRSNNRSRRLRMVMSKRLLAHFSTLNKQLVSL